MNEILFMGIAFMAGILLGILFFYGLWFTVKKAVTAKTPALWLLGSSLLRTAIVLCGFYYVSQGSWQRLLICLSGFITARYMVKRFTHSNEENQLRLKKEVSHAS
jgi:F1F0 ATPase subunit 2